MMAIAAVCEFRGGAETATVTEGCVLATFAADGGTDAVANTVASAAAATARGAEAAISPCAAALSAAANSPAHWNRSSGRLASALRTTASIAGGACTLKRDGGSGFSSSTLRIVLVDVPLNGRSPVRN